MPHALAVDDDPNFLSALAELIEGQGFTTNTACTLRDARSLVTHRTPDVALVDLYLPDGSGIELLKDLELGASTDLDVAYFLKDRVYRIDLHARSRESPEELLEFLESLLERCGAPRLATTFPVAGP